MLKNLYLRIKLRVKSNYILDEEMKKRLIYDSEFFGLSVTDESIIGSNSEF